jgi:pimeloyl-ACP methyl ester carboxylesterase
MRLVLTWAGLVFGAWLIWGFVLFLVQRRMIFPGRDAPPLREGETLRSAQLHRLVIPGAVVEAWWLPAAKGTFHPGPAVLFMHGNYELVDDWVDSFGALQRAGVGVLLMEYPGYGRSTGVATEASVTAASVAAWDLLASMPGEVDSTRIIAFGRSVGGGAACALSRQRPIAALVLSAAFTSVRSYARRYFLPGFLVRHPFDNEGAVRSFRGPVLVQHGIRDATVPFLHGERLASVAEDGRLLSYDCSHDDCPWDRMLADVISFLRGQGILTRAEAL